MLTFTDHAVLRYIERKYAVDIEMLRRDLSAKLIRAARAAETIGEDQYAVRHDGLRFIIKNNCVVTTLTDDMLPVKLKDDSNGCL